MQSDWENVARAWDAWEATRPGKIVPTVEYIDAAIAVLFPRCPDRR